MIIPVSNMLVDRLAGRKIVGASEEEVESGEDRKEDGDNNFVFKILHDIDNFVIV